MNPTLRAAIDAELATLTPLVRTPVAPLGYGSDLSCDSDLTETMVELAGDDPLVLAQALVRRLDTVRGSLPDDPNYGYDVVGQLNAPKTDAELRALERNVELEWRKDDRVGTATVEVTFAAADGSEIRISGTVTPADPTKTPFSLTLAVTSAGALLEELSR
jgi:hypothetical protein